MYTLTSVGRKHVKFWTLAREPLPDPKLDDAMVVSTGHVTGEYRSAHRGTGAGPAAIAGGGAKIRLSSERKAALMANVNSNGQLKLPDYQWTLSSGTHHHMRQSLAEIGQDGHRLVHGPHSCPCFSPLPHPPPLSMPESTGGAVIGRRGEVQDFLCMCFLDDSPPLRYWDAEVGALVEAGQGITDHSYGRCLVGTKGGDIYVFEQVRTRGRSGGGADD